MTELARRDDAAVERRPSSMLEAVMSQVTNPDVDPARLQAFLDVGRQLQRDLAEQQFNAAFAQLKAELPVISKKGQVLDKKGQLMYRYARYDDLHKGITPLLTKHGFATSFDFEEPGQGRLTVILHLLHLGGFSRDYRWTLPAAGQNQFVSNLQNAAAARTFGKRCVLIDALDILTEDQDSDGAPTPPPELVTDEQVMDLETMVQEAENREKGARVRFMAWLKSQYQAERLGELHQGAQHDAVRGMLAKKLGAK